MKIAFITRFQVVETQGGTERITKRVANILSRQYGIECYSLYFNELSNQTIEDFKEKRKIDNLNRDESIRRILHEWEIDIVISQNEFETAINLRRAIGHKIKIVFVHHFQPGGEALALGCHIPLRRLFYGKKNDKITSIEQILGAPYFLYKKKCFPSLYRKMYCNVDRLILLSKGFVKPFSRYASVDCDDEKVTIIPNMLSFDTFANDKDLKNKQKHLLVVSRMDETHKKLSRALHIWKEIMKEEKFADWELDIVGNGPDMEYYKKLVKKNGIPNINFHGSQNPKPFYLKSPLFLMTSESEGWGLTLTEAQQFGCVPIAFDTYESLHDIITDGKNGFIIPRDDMKGFIDKLKFLMTNVSDLAPIMKNAVSSSKRFSAEIVGKEWFNMLSSL
ncbi:MAG: glycosyltransferase [Muribaculaceae bacterium]|nr:glycosyltransferase [Muribaculaceae bacterium]